MDSERGWGITEALSSTGDPIWHLQHGSRPGLEWKDGEEEFPCRSMGPEGPKVHSPALSFT